MNKRIVLCVLTLLILLTSVFSTAVYAQDDGPVVSHEDPAASAQIYSAITLLRYYSVSLDFIIQKDETGSVANLEKMPFANISEELNAPTGKFAVSGMEFTHTFVELFELWDTQNELIRKFRLTEATPLYIQITGGLPTARELLTQLKSSVIATGDYLKIDTVSPQSELKRTYDEVLAKIQQLSDMLDLLSRTLLPEQLTESQKSLTPEQLAELLKSANLSLTAEQLAALTPEQLAELLKSLTPEQLAALLRPTELTLEIDPSTAYVGDEISFRGVLTTQGKPLAERQITILLNNTDLLTIQTDTQGHYQGEFQLPYRYVHEVSVQAIFYPQGNDTGIYLAATSPVLKITVLFYTAQLTLIPGNPAYPGRATTIQGDFSYGDAPVLAQRPAELYLDDVLTAGFTAGTTFTQTISIDAQATTGQHLIAVSVPASGRYAPVFATCVLLVAQATPVLDLNAPGIGIIPGNIGLSGRVYSDIGPLANASVIITAGKANIQVTTAPDGTFSTKLHMGMGLILLGTQTMTVQVQPEEPWNAPLAATKSILIINAVNCGIILIVLVVLGVYLPRRFKKWFGVSPGKKVEPPEVVLPVVPATYQDKATVSAKARDNRDQQEETANPILYWYRIALKLIQKITKAMLMPQQTLREYARNVGRILGPAGKYFMELTYITERRLYGKEPPAAEDAVRSKQLSRTLQEETKIENS
jgi:hypothetical protein